MPNSETDYELRCVSCVLGRTKRQYLAPWVVCVCVRAWCPSACCGFSPLSVGEVQILYSWSCLCVILMKQRCLDATRASPSSDGVSLSSGEFW